MGTTTTNCSLYKPTSGEPGGTWGPALNTNFDTIDYYLSMLPIVHFDSVQIVHTVGKSINLVQTPVVY